MHGCDLGYLCSLCICRWCYGSRAGVDRVEGIKQSIVQRDDGGDKDGVAKSCCSPVGVALVTLHALGWGWGWGCILNSYILLPGATGSALEI